MAEVTGRFIHMRKLLFVSEECASFPFFDLQSFAKILTTKMFVFGQPVSAFDTVYFFGKL